MSEPTKDELVHLLISHLNQATTLAEADAEDEAIWAELGECLALAEMLVERREGEEGSDAC